LLHGDIFTRERMQRFGMVDDRQCCYCGSLETVKHMLWDCNRVRGVWETLNNAFIVYDPGGVITYNSIFVGFSPTIPVLESVLTRVTRSIVSIERQEVMQIRKIKEEIISHSHLNIYSMRSNPKIMDEWNRFKILIETLM
jgi:hypothetical protein